MGLIETIDSSHILDKISKIPSGLVTEIVIIIFIINLTFSYIYYFLYNKNSESFKNIHQEKTPITYFDFFYYANTLFFSLGYDIVPQTQYAKLFTMIHLKLGFIMTTIFIAKIINNC
jgi:hypothetical protein